MQFQNLIFDQKMKLQELEKEKPVGKKPNQDVCIADRVGYIFVSGHTTVSSNNHQKQKANKILTSTLDNLKTTQSQLIQSEKMAALENLLRALRMKFKIF